MLYFFQSVIFHVESHPDYPQFLQCVSFNFFPTPYHKMAYNIFCLLALYGVPLLIIIVCYSRILWEISRRSRDSDGKCIRRNLFFIFYYIKLFFDMYRKENSLKISNILLYISMQKSRNEITQFISNIIFKSTPELVSLFHQAVNTLHKDVLCLKFEQVWNIVYNSTDRVKTTTLKTFSAGHTLEIHMAKDPGYM